MDLDRKTIENDEKFLRQSSTEVDFEKDNVEEIVAQLKQYCDQHYCYALSPVQIGIPKRIIYIKNSTQNMENNDIGRHVENIIYINPTINSATGHTSFLEGCMSCIYHKSGKTIYYTGIVDRPYKVEVTYYDVQGYIKTKKIEGFEATVFCHEYDHLNGILHLDISKQKFEMTLDEMKEYRLNHPYEIISVENQSIKNEVRNKNDLGDLK